MGLILAIVGGFLVSALGGSRFQIGGPAGAFIVLVAATVAKYGVEGLLLTVMMSGILLALVGLSRLGSLIRHIPHAVTVGFTCGIAIIIVASQLKDLGGLRLAGAEPGLLLPQVGEVPGRAFRPREFRPLAPSVSSRRGSSSCSGAFFPLGQACCWQ